MSRLLYTYEVNGNTTYASDQNSEDYRTDSICHATLVTSATTEGHHLPAVDIDIKAVITVEGSKRTLWLDVNMSKLKHAKLINAFKRAGLASQNAKSMRLRSRRRLYASVKANALDISSMWDTAIRLTPEFLGNFEELVESARELTPGESFKAGPEMKSPVPIELIDGVDFMLVPSSTGEHSHLYADHPMVWEHYIRLLKRMVNSKIVEPGYLGASIRRKATNLRRPGYFKEDLSLTFPQVKLK